MAVLRRLRLEAAKWGQTLQISWSQRMAYKLHFILLVIGPTVVFFFVKYNVWSSIYHLQGVETIRGYDLREMLRYQAWVMIVTFLSQSYNGMRLAQDIRLGRISSYLIYPFEFWQFHGAGFLAFQLLQLVVAAVTLLGTIGLGLVPLPAPGPVLAGAGYSLLVGAFWFAVSYSTGLAAFWLEETWVLRVIFTNISAFLSGAIIPLEIYPDWARTLLGYTPFPYITFVPVKIFMDRYAGSALEAAGIIAAWTVVAGLVAAGIWKRGLRLYTAAGM